MELGVALCAEILRRLVHMMAGSTGNVSLMRLMWVRLIRSGLRRKHIIGPSVTAQAGRCRGGLGGHRRVAVGAGELRRNVLVDQKAVTGAGYGLGVQRKRKTYPRGCEDRGENEAVHQYPPTRGGSPLAPGGTRIKPGPHGGPRYSPGKWREPSHVR